MSTDHLHYIEHTHQAGDGILTKFICKGDRTSECHQYPLSSVGMEAWRETDRDLCVAHDECWMRFWMEDADCTNTCCPGGEPVRSGPINVTFNGDCVEWEYIYEMNDR